MDPQAFKVVNTHYHEISVCTNISRLIHAQSPNIVIINGGVQYGLATLEFKQGEKLEFFIL